MTTFARDEGFTLLEVVLAVALLAFAASIVYPIFGQAPSRIQAMQVRKEAQLQAQSLFAEMAVKNDWSVLPKSEAAAEWISLNEKWDWRAYEVVENLDGGDAGTVPGRRLRLSVQVRPAKQEDALVQLDEILWVPSGP